MVKHATLTSFKTESAPLLVMVNKKIMRAKVSPINENLSSKLKVDINVFTELLNGLEAKFRRCEMLHLAYFQNVDHAILSGSSASLPFLMDCTFTDGTVNFKYIYECDDKQFYKEVIDLNFQNFILVIASIYENLVILSEILLKKVIVHLKDRGPLSSPLHDYLAFLDVLISLGYRKNDVLYNCILTFNIFFKTYLLTINQLRNRFIHGYSVNLNTDGFNYKLITFEKGAFTAASPLLNLDAFTEAVLNNTRNFIRTLFVALEQSTRHHSRSIPA